jgi:hypothetical protein
VPSVKNADTLIDSCCLTRKPLVDGAMVNADRLTLLGRKTHCWLVMRNLRKDNPTGKGIRMLVLARAKCEPPIRSHFRNRIDVA